MDEFSLEKKIYYHDTDCGGVVYYANYLKYCEEARTELFAARGINLGELSEKGLVFVVARVEIDYKAPVHYQERIRILTSIEGTRAAAITFLQKVFRGETLAAEARTTIVSVGRNLRPVAMPEEIAQRLKP
jgi:tol-pal system-associated acyl-CoA thioesterase